MSLHRVGEAAVLATPDPRRLLLYTGWVTRALTAWDLSSSKLLANMEAHFSTVTRFVITEECSQTTSGQEGAGDRLTRHSRCCRLEYHVIHPHYVDHFDKFNFVQEENLQLRTQLHELEKRVSDLTATIEFLLDKVRTLASDWSIQITRPEYSPLIGYRTRSCGLG